jgi:hypothetical protein
VRATGPAVAPPARSAAAHGEDVRPAPTRSRRPASVRFFPVRKRAPRRTSRGRSASVRLRARSTAPASPGAPTGTARREARRRAIRPRSPRTTNHLARRQVDAVPTEAAFLQVEWRPRSDQLGRARLGIRLEPDYQRQSFHLILDDIPGSSQPSGSNFIRTSRHAVSRTAPSLAWVEREAVAPSTCGAQCDLNGCGRIGRFTFASAAWPRSPVRSRRLDVVSARAEAARRAPAGGCIPLSPLQSGTAVARSHGRDRPPHAEASRRAPTVPRARRFECLQNRVPSTRACRTALRRHRGSPHSAQCLLRSVVRSAALACRSKTVRVQRGQAADSRTPT